MRFDLITIFPEFFAGPLDYGILRRARQAGLIETHLHDLREHTRDRHRTTDDRPFGGGAGMVMKPEPLFEAVEALLVKPAERQADSAHAAREFAAVNRTAIVLLSASGKLFRQETARRFAALEGLILLCGRYEGVDERVAEHLATDEISIGDFVLSGGELAAAMITDAVTRLIPGALGNEDSAINESFSELASELEGDVLARERDEKIAASAAPPAGDRQAGGRRDRHFLLDYPHYTRPASYRGWEVPEVLISGNHEEIRRWRLEKALEKTRQNRPDLLP